MSFMGGAGEIGLSWRNREKRGKPRSAGFDLPSTLQTRLD